MSKDTGNELLYDEGMIKGRIAHIHNLIKGESGLTLEQVQRFFQATPKEKIKERPAKGGGTWRYVEGSYVTQVLNSLFGFHWEFTVETSVEEALKSAATGTVVVKGRLKVKVGNDWVVKEQFGKKEIAFKNEPDLSPDGRVQYEEKNGKRVIKMKKTTMPLDFGNDMKAAATDAKKKCAAELGLFADVYSQDNFFEAQIIEEVEPQKAPQDEVESEIERAKKEMQQNGTSN